MVSRSGSWCHGLVRGAPSAILCPDCAFPCSRAPGRGLRTPAQTPRQAGGGLPERVCPVGPLSIVPRRLAGGFGPAPPGRRRDGKAQSVRCGSRRLRFSVQSGLRSRPADPGTNPPPGWRGIARARLPSWATFHSAPQPGGGFGPAPSRGLLRPETGLPQPTSRHISEKLQ